MKKAVVVLAVVALLGAGGLLAGAENFQADNSGRNAADATGATVSAADQSKSDVDVEITRSIRKAVMATEGMSINAKNAKIITIGGIVTLRGPVGNENEKNAIAAMAKSVSGVTRVNNELEIAAP